MILLFISHEIICQRVIKGTITAKETGEPLPFTHITLSNRMMGTVTNLNGQFKLIVPEKHQNESVIFSFIGYENKKINLNDISDELFIQLEKDKFLLKEAIVIGYTGKSLIEKAIQLIPKNFQGNEHISKGFYRVISQKESEYVHLSEAEFEIYKPEQGTKNLFKLNKIRAIRDMQGSHGVIIGQTPSSLINSDIVNNLEESDLLSKKGRKNHEFNLEGLVKYKNTSAYLINVKQKGEVNKVTYSGKIYIDSETFAFLHIDIKVTPQSLRYVKFGNAITRAAMKLIGMKAKVLASHTQFYYKKIGNQYYLNSTYDDEFYNIKNERGNYDFNIDSKYQYTVTEIQTNQIEPFSKDKTLTNNKLLELKEDLHDINFWNGYNIIMPDKEFSSIAKSIEKKNNSSNIKQEINEVIFKYPKHKSSRIDSILSFYHRKGLFNGNALITYQDRILLHKSYDKLTPHLQVNSQFRIGSVSKTFTSMLIMMLVNEGKLNIDDSVGKILPGFKHPDILVSQLMSHQSGIPNLLTNNENAINILSKDYDMDELLRKFCSAPLEFEPGSQFKYSNSGFVVLAAIIEKVTQKQFDQVLKEKIFDPLGMKDTYFGKPETTQNLAIGYLYGNPEPHINTSNFSGAGGITSTTLDLLKWSNALENDKLLPRDKIELLFQPRAAYLDWEADYGFGWMLDKYKFAVSKNHLIKYHPGTSLGFYSMFLKQPDKGITIILLSNNSSFPRFDISDLLLDQLDFKRPARYEK